MKRALLLTALSTACATTSPRQDLSDVRTMVAARTDGQTTLPSEAQAQAMQRRTAELLSTPLGADGAVELALLHNLQLAATLEEVGIARADLVQAGLLQNPSVQAGLGFPLGAGVLAPQVGVSFDVLGIFLLPLRKKLAGHELEAAKLRVADAVLDLMTQVRVSFFTLQARLATVELLKTIAESEQQAALLAKRQFDTGNVNGLDLSVRQGAAAEASLSLQRAELGALGDREMLGHLMGLSGSDNWLVSSPLPAIPPTEPSLSYLEELAVARRLDLQAADQEIHARQEALQLADSSRYTPNLTAGASLSRDAEGTTTLGPTVGLSLPIFDQGQARVARLTAELRRSQDRRAALELTLRSEARLGYARLSTLRALAKQYEQVLVPLKARAVVLSQRQYDAMLLGVYGLLEAKRSELTTDQAYIDSVRDYWIARAQLERTIAGPVSDGTAAPIQGGRQ